MNHDRAMLLVAALRSGKYKQGRNRLKTKDGKFCCLGVACEISGLGAWEDGFYRVGNSQDPKLLPMAVADWYETKLSPGFNYKGKYLAILNDKCYGFGEIADLIEAHWADL